MSDSPELSNQDSLIPPVIERDETLLASKELALSALLEITTHDTIGDYVGYEVHGPHVLSLFFACTNPAYPHWRWVATLSRIDEAAPVNVLELELLPGDGALVAPEWVPWSVRLAQYREMQSVQAAEEEKAAREAASQLKDEDEVDPEDDLLENDFSDFEDEIDGVNVDGEDSDLLSGVVVSYDDDVEGDDDDDDDDGDDDDDDEDEDDDVEVDEDGFADLDEHDLIALDDDDDDLDIDELSLES